MDTTQNPATGPSGRGSESRQQSNFRDDSTGFRPERQGPSLEEIQSALNAINPDCDRDQWVQICMGIKAELGDSGFAVFDDWSRGGKSYQQTDCRDTWKSIKPGGGTTIKTLFKMAHDAGWQWTPPPRTGTQNGPSPGGRTGHTTHKHDPEAIWAACLQEIHEHAYLRIKAVYAFGLRLYQGRLVIGGMDCNGALAMLLVDGTGKAMTIQFISATGEKRFLPGCPKKGAFHVIGTLTEIIVVCEGFATGSTIHMATGYRVIVAVDSGNLMPVSQTIRAAHPHHTIVVAGDDDAHLPSNPGRTKATEAAAAIGGYLATPDFGTNKPECATDFNDLAAFLGLEAVKVQLAGAKRVEQGAETQTTTREDDRRTDTHPSQFQVKSGNLPSAVRHAEAALLASGDVYQQGGQLIRLLSIGSMQEIGGITRQAGTLTIRRVDLPWLGLKLGEVTAWARYNARTKTLQPIDCPQQVAIAVLGDSGRWPFPELLGTIDAPTLRPDGSILHIPGYDQSTGLWLAENSVRLDHAALEKPSESDARKALGKLKALVGTFPFVTEADRSVGLSGILTAPIRRSIPTSPLHAYSAPVPGSGKSKLVDLAAVVSTGRPATVINHGKTDDEFEKRLGASLLSGDHLIAIDNISRPLGGDLLCQALTQASLKIRPLGASVQAVVPSKAFIATTGNNLILPADMTRRTVLCTIDPACERPELRRFDSDPVTTALSNRDELLTAALVILRAHHLAGRPGMNLIPLGSFEVWSGWVRAALVWLGEADPCQTIESVRSADPELQQLQAVLVSWYAAYGNQRVSVQAILRDIASQHRPEQISVLREALLAVAGDGGTVNSRRLGSWLGHRKNRIVNGMLVGRAGMRSGNQLWAVSVSGGGTSNHNGSFLTPTGREYKGEENTENVNYIRVTENDPLMSKDPLDLPVDEPDYEDF